MADATRREPDENLPGARLGQFDVLHDERLRELLEYGGTHLHACTP
jgi:hypothetical protein